MAINGDVNKCNNVYVKHLTDNVDDEDLYALFKPFGRILSAKVLKTYDGKKRGCGFVSFMETESVGKAVEEMNGKEVNGQKLCAVDTQKKAERQGEIEPLTMDGTTRYQGLNLYVKNLDDVIDDEWLRKEFSQFGKITSAKVMTDNGKSKGFGFVCFSSPEEGIKAMTTMYGRIMVKKPLYVAMAQRKEDRKAHLATQYMQRVATMRTQMDPMLPTLSEGAQNFTPQMGVGLSWPNQLASEVGPQNMLAPPQVRHAGSATPLQTTIHPTVSISALTGQSTVQPWPTSVLQSNVSGHPMAVSMPSQLGFPYSVNMYSVNNQNTNLPWVTMPILQNMPGHPGMTSPQAFAYRISQPALGMREADVDHLPHPVISPSPPQRPLTIPPWPVTSSPRPMSPSPVPVMRFLTPPPRLPSEYLRQNVLPPQPVSSNGIPRHTEQFNLQRTPLNVKKFEETDGANIIYEEPDHL